MEEKVSVVVPVYNLSEYLASCLDSIIGQSYGNIEIICVNDGSVDSASDILEKYEQFDPRVKVISTAHKGAASARNTGMSAACGKYILFVDSDDYISSVAVERLVHNAEKNKSDVVIFDYIWKNFQTNGVNLETIKSFKEYYKDKPFSIDKMGSLSYKLVPVALWTKFYNADFLKDNGITFNDGKIFEDIPFWADVYVKAKRITYLNEPLYFYNLRLESILNNRGDKVFDIISAYECAENILKKSGYWKKFKVPLQAQMMTDYINKFNLLTPELHKEYFERLKSLKKDVCYKVYEDSSYTDSERACAKRFEFLNSVDYATFCATPFEVKYNA